MAEGKRKSRLEGALPRVSDYMKKWAEKLPDHNIFIYHDEPTTYQQFSDSVHQLAKYLIKIGVQKGDRLGYVTTGRPEFFVFYLAASMVGAIIVGMNVRHTVPEMVYILGNCEASHVLTLHSLGDVNYQDRLREALKQCPSVGQVWVIGGAAELPNAIAWDEIMKGDYTAFNQALQEREAEVGPDDPLIIVYTSGTTGQPKGAVLTHRNIISMSLVEITEFCAPPGMQPEDHFLHASPVNHVSGATDFGIAPMIAGSTQVLMDYFDPRLAAEMMVKYKVPLLTGVPAMYALFFSLPNYREYDTSHVRFCVVSGSSTPREIIARLKEITPYCCNSLGMTETAGYATYNDVGASVENVMETVGKIAPEFELKIADSEGNELPRGTPGEICYRGPIVFKEYYKMPEATTTAFHEGRWLRSGDVGYLDENDDLHLVGRLKEMYITGGFNVYPAEIEDRIVQYPGVLLVAVIPLPHPIMGEVGRAYIMPKPGATLDGGAIQAYLAEYLADYKIPRQYVFRESLPMTTLGKIEKKVLRQEVEREFA